MAVNIIESYEVRGRLYVNSKFLSVYFNKSDKQISRYKKDGMPVATKPKELKVRGDVFELSECISWIAENINSSKSRATNKRRLISQDMIPEQNENNIEETVTDINGKIKQANQMLQLKGTTQEDADRIKKILDGLIQAVKLGEQTKELIPKRDTEKVIVEFVATLIAGYKRDIKILPKDLKQRNEEEIRHILESTYRTNIEKYKKMVKTDMLSEAKLYDIMEVIIELIQNEVSLDKIMGWLKNE